MIVGLIWSCLVCIFLIRLPLNVINLMMGQLNTRREREREPLKDERRKVKEIHFAAFN